MKHEKDKAMKITDLTIQKEEMADGHVGLACRATFEDGTQLGSAVPWRNTLGLWASDAEARDPAEIVAFLRLFANALERATKDERAA